MILLVYPPFCTPSIMPYSISYLRDFLKNNSVPSRCLDLNAKFHRSRFSGLYLKKDDPAVLETLFHDAARVYSENNRSVVNGGSPELIDEMAEHIIRQEPDAVAFSIVYNSQNFYCKALIEKIMGWRQIPIIVGGPAVSDVLKDIAVYVSGPADLVEYAGRTVSEYDAAPDFSDYDEDDYLTSHIIYPYKSTTSCYYKRCAFCTHHQGTRPYDLPLRLDKEYYCFIDDLIPVRRLKEISENIGEGKWWAQLRPSKELVDVLPDLRGLKSIAWGVESGSQRVLDMMDKGTNIRDIEHVLSVSRQAGIINTVFIMFGFPGETEEDFFKTIEFLKRNSHNIDLVSTSVFGLQKGSIVYENPEKYGIRNIREEKRTILGDKITFERSYDVRKMKRSYKKTIESINKFPKVYNYFKEQTLLL